VATGVLAHLPACLFKGGGRESPLDQVRDGLREEGEKKKKKKKEEHIARRYSREKHSLFGRGEGGSYLEHGECVVVRRQAQHVGQ
jgi:hypothetical protein